MSIRTLCLLGCFALSLVPAICGAQFAAQPRFNLEPVAIREPFEQLKEHNRFIALANGQHAELVSFNRRRRLWGLIGIGMIAGAASYYPRDKSKYDSQEYFNRQTAAVATGSGVLLFGGFAYWKFGQVGQMYRDAEQEALRNALELRPATERWR